MGSRYQDLEQQIVSRLQSEVTALAKVSAAAFPGSVETTTDSEAFVFFTGAKTGDRRYIAGVAHIIQDVEFAIAIHKRDTGGAEAASRLGVAGAYELLASVISAILGFQPTISNTPNVFPCILEEEGMVDGGSDSVEIVTAWSLKWEIAEALS